MKKEFVLFEEALALQSIGFDEYHYFATHGERDDKPMICSRNGLCGAGYKVLCNAPLYQQAFRWFRTEHKITHCVNRKFIHAEGKHVFDFQIWDDRKPDTGSIRACFYPGGKSYETYEDAELACLKKIIEIVKESK